MDTVIITTVSNWYEVPRIRHQVAMQMSRFYNVLYVETPKQWKNWYNTKIERVEKNIIRCKLTNHFILPGTGRIFQYMPFLKDYHEKFLLKEIHRIINIHKNSKFILINFNYDFLQIMKEDIFQLKLYLCNDDFPAMLNGKIKKIQMIKREQKVVVNADICLGVSYFLVNKLKNYNDNSYLLLPGHEFNVNREKRQPKNKKINIAFMGYINLRIKYEWLEYAARQKDIEVHLIGPIEKNNKISLYLKNKIFIFHKSKYGQELQNFLESMDVLAIPLHLRFNPEASTAPNKLFSYIAAGKPVVSTNFPNFIKFDYGLIYFADSKESFVSQIRKAYNEDSEELRKKRFDIAEKNTWEKRGNELKAIIDKNINKKFKYKTKK